MTFEIDTPAGRVSGVCTLPPGHVAGGAPLLVLAHGAGSDMRYAPLVRLSDGVARAGFAVCRFNFAYREAGRRVPDRMPGLRATYGAVVERLRKEFPGRSIELVIDASVSGTNPKVSNLINMSGRIAHDIIVLADSDIRVRPDYLSRRQWCPNIVPNTEAGPGRSNAARCAVSSRHIAVLTAAR